LKLIRSLGENKKKAKLEFILMLQINVIGEAKAELLDALSIKLLNIINTNWIQIVSFS